MSDLQSRIRTLRQQAGIRLPQNEETPIALACKSELPDALKSWLQKRRLQTRSKDTRCPTRPSSMRPLPGLEISPGLQLHEHSYAALEPWPDFRTRFRPEGHFATRQLLYFDTETTGLSGGTGTRAFMIGCADWCEGRLRIRQLVCTRMAAESAMLTQFSQWLGPDTVLVSYNGKSFDLPLLKTRLRLASLPDLLSSLDHIDLIYPARRLYRGRWGDCRLGTLENHLLKLVRDDDLPGSEAPEAWLTYLRLGATTALTRVIDHNTQDLRSLHGLLWHLIRIDEEAFELRN